MGQDNMHQDIIGPDRMEGYETELDRTGWDDKRQNDKVQDNLERVLQITSNSIVKHRWTHAKTCKKII